jgi:hypothetical protein
MRLVGSFGRVKMGKGLGLERGRAEGRIKIFEEIRKQK